jgi:GT2 family glycosyltransferase
MAADPIDCAVTRSIVDDHHVELCVRAALARGARERVQRAGDRVTPAKRHHDDADPSHSPAPPIRAPPVAAAIAQAYPPDQQPPAVSGYRLSVLGTGGESKDAALVSVVVVTHNNSEMIGDCLQAIEGSLRKHDAEIIVVDNASSDRTLDLISSRSGSVRVVALQENVGFAAAVNLAIRGAGGGYLALVNSDAFPDPGCIDELVDTLERNPQVGIVGAKLRYPSGRLQPSAGTFPSLLGGLWVALFLHRVPGLSRAGIGFLADERLYRRTRRVDWVSGAVCAARADAGPLPATSFMYGEDVEWALACREAGWETWLAPAATAIHIGRASVDRSQDRRFAQRQRARFELAWFARRGPRVQLAARCVLFIHALLRLLVYGGLSVLRGRSDPRVTEYAALLRAAMSFDSLAA